jgi:hypothetical protein
VLIESAQAALDLVVALQPPAFGQDREAHATRVRKIESLVHPLRKSRRPSPKPPLPKAREIEQLTELSGRRFACRREQIANTLQGYIDAMHTIPRTAPDDVRNAIRKITRNAKPLLNDADEAWRAFHAGGYKAAVVMAGATLEGVLQAAVARLGEPTEAAYRKVYPRRKTPADADSYRFEEALGVLKQMGVLTSAVSHVARGIKELRNFVHPAVQKRQRGRVTDTRALLALQAVAALCEELAERLETD